MYIPDGKKLKALRVAHGLKQRELASNIKASATWVAMLENEQLTHGDVKRIERVCAALGVAFDDVKTDRKYKMAEKRVAVETHIIKIPDYENEQVKTQVLNSRPELQEIQYHVRQTITAPSSDTVLTCKEVEQKPRYIKLQNWMNEGLL